MHGLHRIVVAVSVVVGCTMRAGAAPSILEPLVLPPPPALGTAVQPYIKVSAKRIALTHVRVIDGTGSGELTDRTIVIEDGKILSIGASADAAAPATTVLDLSGHTVIPGIVGMHDHLYYI